MTTPDDTPPSGGESRRHWLRGLYMLLFFVIYNVVEALVVLVALFQLGHTLITGAPNPRLRDFGAHLSAYVYAIMRYLTYGTEDRPYPFNPWPSPPETD